MRQYHDTDYLAVSAALHARTTQLLTRERLERMLDAPTAEDAWKTAVQCGYPELERCTLDAVEHALGQARGALYRELRTLAPDARIVELFEIKYDYHNAKAALKAGDGAQRLMIDCGRCPAQDILDGSLRSASPVLRRAIAAAKAALADEGAQSADLLLDRACFAERTELAEASGSAFLKGYVALEIDALNLRTLVRSLRMGHEDALLGAALLPGGTVAAARLAAARGPAIAELFHGSALAGAAELAPSLLSGGKSLTEFERACDDALMTYLRTARRTAFGEAVVVGYLGAKEAELTAVRTVMAGKLAGLDAAAIRPRLRETYL